MLFFFLNSVAKAARGGFARGVGEQSRVGCGGGFHIAAEPLKSTTDFISSRYETKRHLGRPSEVFFFFGRGRDPWGG